MNQNDKKPEVKNDIPVIKPEYLTKNNLWDSDWLMEKYPERFSKTILDESKVKYDREKHIQGYWETTKKRYRITDYENTIDE